MASPLTSALTNSARDPTSLTHTGLRSEVSNPNIPRRRNGFIQLARIARDDQ